MTAESPEKALQILESTEDYPKINKIINSIDISEKQCFHVFEGEIEDHTEWLVANIEKNEDSKWFVHESINIGLPNSENEKYASGTNTFRAGDSNKSEEIKDNRHIVQIPENDYFIWIELFES